MGWIKGVPLLVGFLVACSSGGGGAGPDLGDTPAGDAAVSDLVPDRVAVEIAELEAGAKDIESEGAGEVDTGDPNRPADRCAAVSDPWTGSALWVDRTAKWNLGADGLNVLGNRLTSVDLDGDGYPDLVVHSVGGNDRDDPESGVFKRRILMNRPSPGGGRRFVDATVESRYGQIPGTEELGRAAHFAVFADVNNDGIMDAFSGTYTDRNNANKIPDRSLILVGTESGVFQAAPASDISPTEEWSTTSASFLDYDRDGNVDLWVGNFYAAWGYAPGLQDRLYRGNGDGTFTDVTYEAGLATTNSGYAAGTNHRPTYGVTACDVNGDGFMDLLQSSYGRQWNMLWLNQGNGTFLEVSRDVGFAADDNMDYFDNQFYRCYCHNEGQGKCDPQPPAPVISCSPGYWGADDAQPWRNGGNTFSTLCADLDGDLDMDVFHAEIVHWHIGESSDPSQVLRNDPSDNSYRFEFSRPGREATGMVRERKGSWNEGDIYVTAFDGDLDGVMDVFLPSSDYPDCHGWFFRGTGGGMFEDIDQRATSGLNLDRIGGVTAADLDLDGDLDVVVAYSTMRCDAECEFDKPVVRLFENTVNGRANWTSIRLEGKGPPDGANRAGISAKVTVYTADRIQVREVSGGYGHFGLQNTTDVHFGLGDACVIDRIDVHWPNAGRSMDTFYDVPANYRLILREGSRFPEYPGWEGAI